MKRFAVLILVLFGCEAAPAERQAETTNSAVKVEQLFQLDGCTMYRFYDGGDSRAKYFARCPSNQSVTTEHKESCGKNCSRVVQSTIETQP